MADKLSLRKINDAIERLCWQDVDVPPTEDEVNRETLKDILKSVESAEEAQHGELQEAFDALALKREKKIENIGYVLMYELDTKIEQLETEILRLTIWKKQIQARRKWLVGYCVAEMLRAGIRKVVGKFIRVTVADNSQRSATVPMDPRTKKPRWELVDSRFIGETVEPKLLKQEAIDHYDKTGELPKGFTIQKGKHLRLR